MLVLFAITALAQPLAAEDHAAITALSPRHDPPACAAIEATMSDPSASWLRIAEEYEGLPWVPLRAATCLLRRDDVTAQHAAARWVVDGAVAGLADVALAELPHLSTASHVAELALAGPHAALATARLQRSSSPALRALVGR